MADPPPRCFALTLVRRRIRHDAVIADAQRPPDGGGNPVTDELHGAVAHDGVDPRGVPAPEVLREVAVPGPTAAVEVAGRGEFGRSHRHLLPAGRPSGDVPPRVVVVERGD